MAYLYFTSYIATTVFHGLNVFRVVASWSPSSPGPRLKSLTTVYMDIYTVAIMHHGSFDL